MLLAEPFDNRTPHIAVSLNPSTFIFFAGSSLMIEDGWHAYIARTAGTGTALLLAKALRLGLISWPGPSPVCWVMLVRDTLSLVLTNPAYSFVVVGGALLHPLVNRQRNKRFTIANSRSSSSSCTHLSLSGRSR